MATEPSILKTTRNGTSYIYLSDDMFQNREIVCVDEINQETVNSLINQILYLAKTGPDEEITIYINCLGGEVLSGLALYDVMQAVPCKIHTICVGIAASMGAILFAAGDRREMLPHSAVLIHDPLTQGISGSALTIQSKSENLMRTRETVCRILAKHTGKTLKEIYKKTATDTYFYAEEAVAYGLADGIIESLYGEEDNV